MLSANLLSASRRRSLVREDRLRFWAVSLLAYCTLLTIAWIGTRQVLSSGGSVLQRRAETVATEKTVLETAIQSLRAKIGATQSSLATAKSISDHPDWSVLLSLIGSLRGGDIEIERVALGARKAETAGKKASVQRGVWLKISGIAKDHRAIAQFALRLESAGLFERVTLADARKTGSEPEGFVGFEIETSIEEPGAGAKP